ncbi:MAG: monofunctional biosynthetic peptidoglycan transglycosylase [bacterium]|nr:monofunctional biosynthetic peptidoglycan transglycosylase [bacterium]
MLRRLLLSLAVIAGSFVVYQWATWPEVDDLAAGDPTTSAFIERHNRKSGGRALHTWAPYADIAPSLKHAVLVAEDIDFFSHRGFAVEEMRIALRESLDEGRKLRGASTITQQLAKNLWLSPSRNPWRKVKEIVLTNQLEGSLSKRRILELYLNVAQFGPDVFGAEAAARHFYGVSAARLTVRQAAELAAGLSRPGSWNPNSSSRGYRHRVEIIRTRMRRARWVLREL